MTASAGVYVVVLNWNGWRDTVECLDSLFVSQDVEFRVVVCDNASTDESMAQLRAWAGNRFGSGGWSEYSRGHDGLIQLQNSSTPLVLIQNGANLGFAGGNNPGVAYAMADSACEFIWLLNNDTVVVPDALACAVSRMRQDAGIGMCGSTLVYYHERTKVQAFGGAVYLPIRGSSRHVGAFSSIDQIPSVPEEIEGKLSYIIGAAMLVRREFIEQVGMMSEDYFLYFEEVDWATRGRGRFKVGYAPASLVYHKEGASIGTSASGGSPLSVYYLYRNRVRFTKRFYRLYLASVLAYSGWEVLKFALKRRWPQARSACRGTIHGLFSF
jgi:GT2 family glycosyltransferase